MKCPYCNHEVEKDSKFCINCGKKIHLKTADDLMKETIEANRIYDTASSDTTAHQDTETSNLAQHYSNPQHSYNTNPDADMIRGEATRYDTKGKEKRCKNCSGIVDPVTKRCRSCGKKYTGSTGIMIAFIIVCLIAVGAAVFALDQMVGLQRAKETIAEQQATINDQESSIQDLESDMEYYQEKSDFLDEYIVFIVDNDDTYYHTYDCDSFWNSSEFYSYNIANAEYMGYKPAPDCH